MQLMIKTQQWLVDGKEDAQLAEALEQAGAALAAGALVAFPTETVYGLGADARNSQAVERIFAAKGRPSDNPLIVHIADREQLDEMVLPYPQLASELMDHFWPGPLTIVLPAREGVLSPLVTAGLATVGVRMPRHRAALALLREAGCPVAAPSANRSGRPSPTLAWHVQEDLEGRIEGIVDDGPTGVGLESTVVELPEPGVIRILRPGGVTREALAHAFPGIFIDSEATGEEDVSAPRSPGMKYTHYAPQGELHIVLGDDSEAAASYIREQQSSARRRGETTGILAFAERLAGYEADQVLSLGSEHELENAAHLLYAALRRMDACGVQRIWAEGCVTDGIGEALMNRMVKAAGGRTIRL